MQLYCIQDTTLPRAIDLRFFQKASKNLESYHARNGGATNAELRNTHRHRHSYDESRHTVCAGVLAINIANGHVVGRIEREIYPKTLLLQIDALFCGPTELF
jgi:hypothetical protein